MKTLSLSHERSARLWIDELPECGRVAVRRRDEGAARIALSRALTASMACIELLVPLGGRFLHGLLGVELLPAMSPLVVVTSSSGSAYAGSLADRLDSVRWGLSQEFAQAVFDGAAAGLHEYGGSSSHSLHFSVAAHGEVGPSSSMFQRLARALVGLVTLPRVRDEITVPTLEQLLR